MRHSLKRMSMVYIQCKVHKGLFDTEYYVLVNGSSAYYVSRDNVVVTTQPKGAKSVDGRVRGYVVEAKKDKTLVQLPGEAVVGGVRTWVDNAAVSKA